MKNDEIIFNDAEGLLGSIGANNDDTSREFQFVYNKTTSVHIIKCATITSTSRTGEFFAPLKVSY